ncbi:MAG: hypothetical protein ABI811_05555 [Acidobacteriota bacterium]
MQNIRKIHRLLTTLAIVTIAGTLFAGFLVAQSAQKAPPPSATLNQLMQSLFFPQSNVVFSTQRQNPAEIKRAPEPSASSDPLTGVFNGWTAVENSALTLIDASDLLMTPGRTCSNGKDVPLNAADWAKLVNDLRDAGKVAYEAAKSKNIERMFEASDVLNTSCSNCHNKYRRANRCQ